MIRQTIGLLAIVALAGCARPDATVGADRVTLATSVDVASFDYAPDGRLGFVKYVAGKAAIFVTDSDSSNARRVSFGVWDHDLLWSPDGKWIALERDAGGANDLAIVPSDSGAERPMVLTGADEQLGGWLPDASGVVFIRSGEKGTSTWLYLMADGSSAKLFDADGSVGTATPSPDGTAIAYSLFKDGKSTLWIWDRATRTHRQLTTEGFEAISPRSFAPDGRSILYESRRTGSPDLWRLDVATGERTQLTQDVAEDASGAWSPDGSRIVFMSNRGGQPDVWVLSVGEVDVQRVTDDALAETEPRWTPDGRSIVAGVRPGHQHLVSIPIAGGAVTPLTAGDWDVEGEFEVSRDGSQVAYTANTNGDADIWTVPASGGQPQLVSGTPGYDGLPTWSPDGKRIAFTSVRSGNRDVWMAAADGSGAAIPLTDWPTNEGTPQWSPDGKSIAFRSVRESRGSDLWTMPVAGGTPKRITHIGTVGPAFRWSPDGSSIAFVAESDVAGGPVVFTIPATGGAPTRLTPSTATGVRWSPDGRQISVPMCKAGYCAIEVRALDGSFVRRLNADAVVYENRSSWSADGTRLLVSFQDLAGGGSYGIALRDVSGGAGQQVYLTPGITVGNAMFALNDGVAIAAMAPAGLAYQRIAAPAPAKVP